MERMTERSYWNKKYQEGGISGKGSIGKYKRWKWKKIYYIIGRLTHKSVVDVGCGDMRFWERDYMGGLRRCGEYVGIDISDEIIAQNIEKYPDRTFLLGNAKMPFVGVSGEVVLCMDLLFHIMNSNDFADIILRLGEYSEKWIVIYNWFRNPFAYMNVFTDNVSQYYRNLKDYDATFKYMGFELDAMFTSIYDEVGCLYFYKRRDD
jgi:hypothetical protein